MLKITVYISLFLTFTSTYVMDEATCRSKATHEVSEYKCEWESDFLNPFNSLLHPWAPKVGPGRMICKHHIKEQFDYYQFQKCMAALKSRKEN